MATSLKRVKVGDADVVVHETLEGDYALYTWPCAELLAQYVYSIRAQFTRKKPLLLVNIKTVDMHMQPAR